MTALGEGSILAGLRIERLLGRGGMGDVWLASDPALDRPVALKVLTSRLVDDAESRLRFLDETRLAASLDHPHIVPIYAAGEAEGRVYLAMRFVEGSDLESILDRDGPMAVERTLALLRGIADGLDAAHARGLVHRDVKPGNILVTPTGTGDHGYLTDFGLAKRDTTGESLDGDRIAGSLGFIAPELIEGRPVDRRADVYSLACTLYAAVSGTSPFTGGSEAAILLAHLEGAPAPLATLRPDLAPLDAVLRTGLAKDPADRPATAGELIRAAADAVGARTVAWTTSAGKANVELPYVGLRAFDEADARFYVGREAETAALVERLAGGRFVAVFGASGSGKSSLVRAGLLPAIRSGALPGSDTWSIEVVRPGALPLEAIAARIVRLTPGAAMGVIVDELATDPRAIHHATELALRDAPATARVVWVIDQAEELFTLTTDEPARRAAIAGLVHAAAVPGGRTVVVLAMRADFYHRCAAYPELAVAIVESQFLVSPMTSEALRRTIEEPARIVGLEFEPGLVDTILQDVADRPGALPLLEHLLFELWDRRRGATLTLAGYRECGGIDGAIAVRAEAIFEALGATDRASVRQILLRLVQPGDGTEDTRRRATLHELTSATDGTANERLIEQLAGARLLTASAREVDGEPVVEVAHEALLRAWPRLRTWIDDDRDALRIARHIAEATADWERLGRDPDALLRGARLAEALDHMRAHPGFLSAEERAYVDASEAHSARRGREAGRRQRILLAAASAAAVFFFALSGLAWVFWTQSEAARRDAVAAQQDAVTGRADAEAAGTVALARQLVAQSLATRTDLQLSTLLALEGLRLADSDEARQNLGSVLDTLPQITTWRDADGLVVDLVASPDGARIAAITRAPDRSTDTSEVGRLRVLDTATWRPIANDLFVPRFDSQTPVQHRHRLAFSPDGGSLAFIGASGAVSVLDLVTKETRPAPGVVSAQIDHLAWDEPDRIRWVGHEGRDDFSPILWAWQPSVDRVSSVALRPAGELPTGGFRSLTGHLAPGGGSLVVDDTGFGLHLMDPATGSELAAIDALLLGFERHGRAVIAATQTGIRLYAIPELRPIGPELRVEGTPEWAEADLDAGTFTAWVYGRTVTRLDLGSGATTVPSVVAPGGTAAIAGTDGAIRYQADQIGRIAVIDLDRAWRRALPMGPVAMSAEDRITLTHDASMLLAFDARVDRPARSVKLVDVATGRSVAEITPNEISGIAAAALSPDGQAIFTLHDSGQLVRSPLDGAAGVRVAMVDPPRDVIELVVAPDGRTIAVVTFERTTILLPDGSIQVRTGSGFADGLEFVDDGRTIVEASCEAGTIAFSDTAGSGPATVVRVGGCPMRIDVDSTGRTLAIAKVDEVTQTGVIDLYDVATRTFLDHVGTPRLVDIALDDRAGGRSAVTITEGPQAYTVDRWDVDPASSVEAACALVGRNLTSDEWTRYVGDRPYHATCPAFPIPPAPAAPSARPSPSTAPPSAEPTGVRTFCLTFGTLCYLSPGRYAVEPFQPPFHLDIGPGWYNDGVALNAVSLVRDVGRTFEIATHVRLLDGGGGTAAPVQTPEAFAAWLRSRDELEVTSVVPARLGGRDATRIDVLVRSDVRLYTYEGFDAEYRAVAGQQLRFVVADVDGSLVHAVVEGPAADFEALWAVAVPLLESLQFD